MKYNPKILLYILMLSTMGINTPLSIIGIISQISEYFNTSIAMSGLYVSSFTFTIAVSGLFIPIMLNGVLIAIVDNIKMYSNTFGLYFIFFIPI